MRQGENVYRKAIVSDLLPYGHVSIVESHDTSIGIPDLNFRSKAGWETWIEIKWAYADKMPDLRPAQVAWHRNRWRVAANSFILLGTEDDEHILIPGGAAESIKTMPNDMEHWLSMSWGIFHSKKPPMLHVLNRIEAEYSVHERNRRKD